MGQWTVSRSDSRTPDARQVQPAREERLHLLFWVGSVLLAAFICWGSRNESSYDTVAYSDLARAVACGNWGGLVNGVWSPGYPVLLGLVLRLLRPSEYWLFGSAHLLNFFIFAAALAAFDFFWGELGRRRGADASPVWVWNLLGYSLVLWVALNVIGVGLIGPDLLFCGILVLTVGLLLRALRTGAAIWFSALGAALGFGYLAKAPMFPVALVMLAVAVSRVRGLRRSAAQLTLAVVPFAAIAAPWIVALHARYGRWTFGDSAALNYAWYVNGARRFIHWQGGPPGRGVPTHPTRQIFTEPEAFEYAGPVAGTYPPWDDPSYWNDGLRPYFDLRQQARAVRVNLGIYGRLMLRPLAAVVAGFLVLAVLAQREGALGALFRAAWEAWLVGAAGLATFALVAVQARYIGGFLVLLWAGLLAGVRVRRRPGAVAPVMLVMAASLAGLVAVDAAKDLRDGFPDASHPQWQVVQELDRAGLGPGDRVALLGWELLWSPMSKMEIIADIPESQAALFWRMSDERRAELLRRLAASGARAIVAGPLALTGQAGASGQAKSGWQPLGETGFQIYLLRR